MDIVGFVYHPLTTRSFVAKFSVMLRLGTLLKLATFVTLPSWLTYSRGQGQKQGDDIVNVSEPRGHCLPTDEVTLTGNETFSIHKLW